MAYSPNPNNLLLRTIGSQYPLQMLPQFVHQQQNKPQPESRNGTEDIANLFQNFIRPSGNISTLCRNVGK